MASYHFNSDDMSVDSEIPIMSSLILNLPAQSLKSACYVASKKKRVLVMVEYAYVSS